MLEIKSNGRLVGVLKTQSGAVQGSVKGTWTRAANNQAHFDAIAHAHGHSYPVIATGRLVGENAMVATLGQHLTIRFKRSDQPPSNLRANTSQPSAAAGHNLTYD